MKNGIEMMGNTRARFRLEATLPAVKITEKVEKVLEAASLYYWEPNRYGKAQDSVQVPAPPMGEDRYVFKDFRALSEIFLVNRGLDFSRPGVLQKAVELLNGKPIYANHDFSDIDNCRGVIAKTWWDAEGADSSGVPGINCQTMVDAFLNYRTACGIMQTPPSINAVSVTVLSEVEFSHPELVKDGTFWKYFLEEVDGEIVRLIATEIIEFWELSFVMLGEDRLAKSLPSAEPEPDAAEDVTQTKSMAATKLNATEKKMKLTTEEKKSLGITTEDEDVPEQTVKDAALALAAANKFSPKDIADLSLNAKAGETLLVEKRKEVTRLAKLAELGADDGDLPTVLAKTIDEADAEELIELETYYRGKVGDKLGGGQSSLENSGEIEAAAGTNQPAKDKTVKPTNLL